MAELRRLAELCDSDTLTKDYLVKHGRVSHSVVVRRFGTLRKALELAGLNPGRFVKGTNGEILTVIVELLEKTLEREGRTPQKKDMKTHGMAVSGETVVRRFGTWRKALVAAHASVTQDSFPEEPITPSMSPVQQARKPLSVRKRFFVMKRDGFACVRCGASGHGVRLDVHHRMPYAHRGSDALVNLETLCFDCNRGQRDSIV